MSTVPKVAQAAVSAPKPRATTSLQRRQSRLAWMMLLPTLAIITFVSAQMWKFMFAQISGVINDMFMRAHLISNPVAWLAQPNTAFPAVCAVDIWKTTPFVALLLLAGLQVISGDVYEAARVD